MAIFSRHHNFKNILLVTGKDIYTKGADDYRPQLQNAIHAVSDSSVSPVRAGTHDFWITYSIPDSLSAVYSYENLDMKPRMQRGIVRVGALPDVTNEAQLREHLSIMMQEVSHHWLVPGDLDGFPSEIDEIE